jgi:hypothetical protein
MIRRTLVASLSALLAVTALVVLVAGAFMAHNGGALLPLRWVDVSGPFARVSAEQIRAAVGPAAARGFLGVDLAEVRAAALSLPWVAEAEVRKVWPDTLEISVREREVLGRLGSDRLVDVSGNVFQARGAGDTRGLPLLAADPAQMPQLAESDKTLIVGLDIGTSKVVAIVGESVPTASIEDRRDGLQSVRGMKKGVVVDIESTVQSIQRAVEEAELMAAARSARSTWGSPAAIFAA